MPKNLLTISLVFSLLVQSLASPAFVLAQTQNPGIDQSVTYTYDNSGNLVDDGERTIIWDVEGKPVKIELRSRNYEVGFVYDSSGSRIAKIVKDAQGRTLKTTLYISGNFEKEISYNPDGSIASQTETKYYPAGSSLAQRKVNRQTGEDELIFIHKDHLSSSTFFTDKQGNKADSLLTYYPYGNERTDWDLPFQPTTDNGPASPAGGQPTTDRLFTGQIKDTETDLYYYNARYYNQNLGQFISPDTVDQTSNRYTYALNNPVLYNDPSGNIVCGPLTPVCVAVAFCAADPVCAGAVVIAAISTINAAKKIPGIVQTGKEWLEAGAELGPEGPSRVGVPSFSALYALSSPKAQEQYNQASANLGKRILNITPDIVFAYLGYTTARPATSTRVNEYLTAEEEATAQRLKSQGIAYKVEKDARLSLGVRGRTNAITQSGKIIRPGMAPEPDDPIAEVQVQYGRAGYENPIVRNEEGVVHAGQVARNPSNPFPDSRSIELEAKLLNQQLLSKFPEAGWRNPLYTILNWAQTKQSLDYRFQYWLQERRGGPSQF